MNGGGELEVRVRRDPLRGEGALDGPSRGRRRRAHGPVGVVAGEGHVAGGAAGGGGAALGIWRGRAGAAAVVVAEDGVDAEGQLRLLSGLLVGDGGGFVHFFRASERA